MAAPAPYAAARAGAASDRDEQERRREHADERGGVLSAARAARARPARAHRLYGLADGAVGVHAVSIGRAPSRVSDRRRPDRPRCEYVSRHHGLRPPPPAKSTATAT